MSSRRPEHLAPPEIFYNDSEAEKYTKNTRMMQIQNEMSERAMELLALPEDEPSFILDIGCGSGMWLLLIFIKKIPWNCHDRIF